MDETRLEGIISFVEYDKKFVSIEYAHNGKKKSINGSIKDAEQQKWIDEKLIKKPHHFRENDEISFELTRSVRGDKMVATRIVFRFNNSLSNLLHRAGSDNQFTGYLKQVDDKYFIKEIGSYHFFPLRLSPWERPPSMTKVNEQVLFSLENFTNPDKVTAVLLRPQFIIEYRKAEKLFEDKKVIDATISKITPHGIYVNVVDEKIQGKLPMNTNSETIKEKVGDNIQILITHLSPQRIAIKRAS